MDKGIMDNDDTKITAKSVDNSKYKGIDMKRIKPSQVYSEQLLCLILVAIISYFNSGPRVIPMVLFSLLGAIVMDVIGCVMTKKIYNPKDLSTLAAGLCIAMLVPSSVSYQLVFFGSALTIGIKHIFGGKDNYIFNPTAAALVFLILCYPAKMLLFPKPLEHLPLWEEINPTLLTGFAPFETLKTFDILIGNIIGPIGAIHILVILVGGASLLLRGTISPSVTLSAIAVEVLFTAITGSGGLVHDTVAVMASGGFLFTLVFLVNDPQTLPKTFLGKIYYGVMFSGFTIIFKTIGKVEYCSLFALLFVNAVSERADIMAAKTVTGIKRMTGTIQKALNSYEHNREKAENEDELSKPHLSDTQEIVIVRQDYNMPPVDNKIVKINRKKLGLLALIKEKIGNISQKRKLLKKPPEDNEVNFLENLREGVKDLSGAFKKGDSDDVWIDEPQDEQSAPEIDPLKLSLIIDDDDVIEITDTEDTSETKQAKPKNPKNKTRNKLNKSKNQLKNTENIKNDKNG